MSCPCAGLPRYRMAMTIIKRLAAVVASALALATAPEAGAWKPRSDLPRMPDKPPASAPPPPTPDQADASVLPPPLALTPRQLKIFASVLVLAAAAAIGAWMLMRSDSSPLSGKPKTSGSAPQAVALEPGQTAACPLQPATVVAGEKDGRFPLQAGVAGLVAADIASFFVIGKEAAAAGRPRDAEVAFLMACQVADKLKGIDSVESAQARYELGSHYARLALDNRSVTAANSAELRSRAERLSSDSWQRYHFKYGQGHEQLAFASQKPVPLQQTLAPGESLQPVLAMPAQENAAQTTEPVIPVAKSTPNQPEPVVAQAQSPKVVVAKSASPAPQGPRAATRPRPGFDCTRARSMSEKMICSDAELARLDRELGRLYASARNATTDRAAFRRQQDQEWRRREALCRDRECLLRWYAQRRYQLTAVIERREQSPPQAPRWGRLPDETAGLYKGR